MGFLSINSQSFASGVIRQLAQASSTLDKTFSRLSSGQRIVSASDDAAGLSISSNLRFNTRVYTQAIRNANDGISALNIAEGAVGQLSTIVMRLQELSTQAANGSLSLTQRRSLDKEANALTSEYNRIIGSTSFNGLKLITGGLSNFSIQVGSGSYAPLSLGLGQGLLRNIGNGTFSSSSTVAGAGAVAPKDTALVDVNGDGKLDLIYSGTMAAGLYLRLGNGDGTFGASTSFATSFNLFSLDVGDINGDGKVDVVASGSGGQTGVYLGNGSGSFSESISYAGSGIFTKTILSDLNGDGFLDLIQEASASAQLRVRLNNGSGGYLSETSVTGATGAADTAVGDFNGDGIPDIAVVGTAGIVVSKGLGDGTFQVSLSSTSIASLTAVSFGDIDHDGYDDIVAATSSGTFYYRSAGNGSFGSAVTLSATGASAIKLTDMNGDGHLDIVSQGSTVSVSFGDGTGSFTTGITTPFDGASGWEVEIADLNGDGVPDVIANGSDSDNISILLSAASTVTTIQRLDLLSQADARSALDTLSGALDRIKKELGNIGSSQSRLKIAGDSASNNRDMYAAADSRITDIDVAAETSTLIRAQIKQQVGSALLAQAGALPEILLSLIR